MSAFLQNKGKSLLSWTSNRTEVRDHVSWHIFLCLASVLLQISFLDWWDYFGVDPQISSLSDSSVACRGFAYVFRSPGQFFLMGWQNVLKWACRWSNQVGKIILTAAQFVLGQALNVPPSYLAQQQATKFLFLYSKWFLLLLKWYWKGKKKTLGYTLYNCLPTKVCFSLSQRGADLTPKMRIVDRKIIR